MHHLKEIFSPSSISVGSAADPDARVAAEGSAAGPELIAAAPSWPFACPSAKIMNINAFAIPEISFS